MLPVCRFIQTYLCLYQQALVKFISLIRMFLRLCADDASLRGRYSHPNDPVSKHQLSHRALISSDPDNSADSTAFYQSKGPRLHVKDAEICKI